MARLQDTMLLSQEERQRIAAAIIAQGGDFEDKEKSATFGGILNQFALGAINSALLDAPKFLLDRNSEDLFRASESGAERVARGTGTVLGFLLGAPARVFMKGSQIGAKLAINRVVPSAMSQTSKKFLINAGKNAGGFAALEAATLPTDNETFFDKAISVPMSAALGGAFGVVEQAIAPIVRPHLQALKERMTNKDFKKPYEEIFGGMIQDTVKYAKSLDKKFVDYLKTDDMAAANALVNEIFVGPKRQFARARVRLVNMDSMKDDPVFQNIMLKGNAHDIANAQIKGAIFDKKLTLDAYNSLKTAIHKVTNNPFISSTGAYMTKQGGSSRQIVRRGIAIRNVGEREAGKTIANFRMILDGSTAAERQNVQAMLDGKVAVPMNQRAKGMFDDIRKLTEKEAQDAINLGVKVKRTRGENITIEEFKPRANYFPHITIDVNSHKQVVDEALSAAVNRGDFKNMMEAKASWDGYVNLVNKRRLQGSEKFLDYLVRTRQARDRNEAFTLMNRENGFIDRMQTRRFGNIEHSRTVNLPFYDVDLQRGMERYFYGTNLRKAEIRFFGQNNEKLNELIQKVKEEGGDYNTAVQLMRRFTGATMNQAAFTVISPQTSAAMRSMQTITKLGLATIPNSTQSINTAMVTGLKNTASAIKFALSGKTRKEAAEFAIRSGATLEAGIQEYIKGLGLDGSFTLMGRRISATRFLEKTGFVWMERMNRTIAAHAGKNYAVNMAQRLIQNPSDNIARRALTNLGISPSQVLKKNGLEVEDMYKAALHVSNKTQFRSGPLDLPLFFTSPEGKLMFQFKTFAFNQAKFIKDMLKEQVAQGNFKPIAVALIAMPILGEGVKDVRGLLTGQIRDEKGMDRLLENIASVGAAGMFTDLWQSAKYNNVEGVLLGPTGSDISRLVEGSQRAVQGRPESLQRQILRNIPVVGPAIQNTLVPSNHLARLREKRDNERDKLRGKNY